MTPQQARDVLEAADLVCPAAVIAEAVARLARELTDALADSFPLVLCVMKGGMVFAGQLLPLLRFPLELDYLDVTRYGDTTRGGEIRWKVTPETAPAGRVVLVLDDVLDEGDTLAAVKTTLMASRAERVLLAVLAEKETGRSKPVAADFTGVRLPNRYVFGCGMDVNGAWRNLPEIYALKDR